METIGSGSWNNAK